MPRRARLVLGRARKHVEGRSERKLSPVGRHQIGTIRSWRLALLIAFMLAGCDKESNSPAQTAEGGDPRRGRALYMSNCAACHNNDPSRDGPVGPAIKRSSLALIEARVLRATYPPGYTPKRKTSAMPAQPYLKSALPDLAAFLR